MFVIDVELCYDMSVKNYTSDTYLLSPEFQSVAQWWDSMVFVDREDPSIVLKLYDPLDLEQVHQYYRIQSEIAQKSGIIKEEDLELRVVDPMSSGRFLITENEDWVLVVLPRIEWVNLWTYWSDIERTRIVNKVKEMLKNKWIPVSWGFEVKPENIMVSDREWWKRLILHITDVWARVDECLKEYSQH